MPDPDCGESKDYVWAVYMQLVVNLSKLGLKWNAQQADAILCALRDVEKHAAHAAIINFVEKRTRQIRKQENNGIL